MGSQVAGVQDRMRALTGAFTLGVVSALPLSSLHAGVGVGHGHHFEQGVAGINYHQALSHHYQPVGRLHQVNHHHENLHHDEGHLDRHVYRLSDGHYPDVRVGHFGKRGADEEEQPEQIQQVGGSSAEKTDQVEERSAHFGFGGFGPGLGYGLGPYGPYGLPYGPYGFPGGYAGYGPYGIGKRSQSEGSSRSKRSPKPFGFGYGLGYGGYGLGYGGLGGYGLGYGLYGPGLYGGHFWKRSSEDPSSGGGKARSKRSPSPHYGFGFGPYYGFGYGGYGLGGYGLYGGHFWKRSAQDSHHHEDTSVRKKRSPSPYYGLGLGPYYGFGYGLGGLYGGYGLYGHGFWRRSVDESDGQIEEKGKVKRSAEPFYGYHGYHDHHHHHHYPYHGYSYGW